MIIYEKYFRSSHMITFWLENGIVITLRTSGIMVYVIVYTCTIYSVCMYRLLCTCLLAIGHTCTRYSDTHLQVIVCTSTGDCVHMYRTLCSHIQVIVYVCTGYCVHTTYLHVFVYASPDHNVQMYWLLWTKILTILQERNRR